MKKLIVSIALAASSVSASAQYITADRFLQLSELDHGFIAATVVDAYMSTNMKDGEICVPDYVTIKQLGAIARDGVKKHSDSVRAWPENHAMYKYKESFLAHATIIIRDAIAKHFGCKIIKAQGWEMVYLYIKRT